MISPLFSGRGQLPVNWEVLDGSNRSFNLRCTDPRGSWPPLAEAFVVQCCWQCSIKAVLNNLEWDARRRGGERRRERERERDSWPRYFRVLASEKLVLNNLKRWGVGDGILNDDQILFWNNWRRKRGYLWVYIISYI